MPPDRAKSIVGERRGSRAGEVSGRRQPNACVGAKAGAGESPPSRSGGGHRSGSAHLTSGGMSDEMARASPAPSSPPAKARSRAMASRGRLSPGASASNSPSTRSAQSAAHTATIRRSASLSVCGEPTPRFSHAFRRSGPPCRGSAPDAVECLAEQPARSRASSRTGIAQPAAPDLPPAYPPADRYASSAVPNSRSGLHG